MGWSGSHATGELAGITKLTKITTKTHTKHEWTYDIRRYTIYLRCIWTPQITHLLPPIIINIAFYLVLWPNQVSQDSTTTGGCWDTTSYATWLSLFIEWYLYFVTTNTHDSLLHSMSRSIIWCSSKMLYLLLLLSFFYICCMYYTAYCLFRE